LSPEKEKLPKLCHRDGCLKPPVLCRRAPTPRHERRSKRTSRCPRGHRSPNDACADPQMNRPNSSDPCTPGPAPRPPLGRRHEPRSIPQIRRSPQPQPWSIGQLRPSEDIEREKEKEPSVAGLPCRLLKSTTSHHLK